MTSRNFEQTLKEILESEALKAGDIIVALDKERPSMLAEVTFWYGGAASLCYLREL